MNEEKLEELLARKRASVHGKFECDEAQFARDFFARIDRRSDGGTRRFWRYAAGFLLLFALALFRLLPVDHPRRSAVETAFVKVDEAVRVFDINARSVAERLAAAGIDCRPAALGAVRGDARGAGAVDLDEWVRGKYGLDLSAVENTVKSRIVKTKSAANDMERGDRVR